MSEVSEFFENLARGDAPRPSYDGIIVDVFPDVVNVRLAGAARRVITNVKIADHIRQEVLQKGMFCKVGGQFDRDGNRIGRYILTDILPQINYGDYAGRGGIPEPPLLVANASCADNSWALEWSAVDGASHYELYWSADSLGTGAELITETVFREYNLGMDIVTPPKIFFAVKALAGLRESDLSAWVTDANFTVSAPLVSFGDDINHGHITSTNRAWWRVSTGKIERSTSQGAAWANVTDSSVPNSWGDSPAPLATDLDYIQVFGDDGGIYVLANWQNDVNAWRSWLLTSADEGSTWTWLILDDSLTTYSKAIWGAVNGTSIAITLGGDDVLQLHIVDVLGFSFNGSQAISNAIESELDLRSEWAFPVTVSDDDNLLFIAGHFNGSDNLSLANPEHIIFMAIDTFAVTSVQNGWGASHCASLEIGPDIAGDRTIKAVKS